jgi:hypothetical protein
VEQRILVYFSPIGVLSGCFKQAVGCVLMKLPLRTISFYWPTGAKLEI